MGFPVGYSEVFIPNIIVQALSVLGFLRTLIIALSTHLDLSNFLSTDLSPSSSFDSSSSSTPIRVSRSASLIRELLPVVKLEDLGSDERSSCAVCLYEVEGWEEIRRLKNCRHIFHRGCIDRWLDHDRDSCPLCRSPLVPDDFREEFKQRFLGLLSDDDYNHEFLYLEYYSAVSVL